MPSDYQWYMFLKMVRQHVAYGDAVGFENITYFSSFDF